MHMVIDIGIYKCGPWTSESGMRFDEKCDRPPPHIGHARITVKNGALPFSSRRPAWAELELDVAYTHSPSEVLRWAAHELYMRTRRPSWQGWHLDDSTWEQEMDVRSGAS